MQEQNWNEHRTRKQYIDKLLINSQWAPIVPFVDGKEYNHASVEECSTQTGPADYVLFNNKRALAAVEGKKVSIGPQNVLQQAQRYAGDFKKARLILANIISRLFTQPMARLFGFRTYAIP